MIDSGIELNGPSARHKPQNVEILTPEKGACRLNCGLPSLALEPTARLLTKATRLKTFNSKTRSEWLDEKRERGFIRVFDPNSTLEASIVVPITVHTSAQQITNQLGLPPYSLHVQYSGDVLRRLSSDERPLIIQDDFLKSIGVDAPERRRNLGDSAVLGYAIKFFAGRPFIDDGFGNTTLSTYCQVRKGRILKQWSRRLCTLDGARLLIYPGVSKMDIPEVLLLSRSKVEETFIRGKGRCIRITAVEAFRPLQIVYLAFDDTRDFNAWITRCVKAAAKVPPISDLSNLQLECLPEQVFCIGSDRLLTSLNLKHNRLQSRPPWEHLRAIGWLEDLPRLQSLRTLNLSDNCLGYFPEAVVHLQVLMELNLASNKIAAVPKCIGKMANLITINLQNNLLKSLPAELVECRALKELDLGFNRFESIPAVLCEMPNVREWNFAGCEIANVSSPSVIIGANHVSKFDLRLNTICTDSTIFMPAALWQSLTHLDIRHNCGLDQADFASLPSLRVLECDDNNLSVLTVNGTSLVKLSAARNSLVSLGVIPLPLNLRTLCIDDNELGKLPEWLAEAPSIERVSACRNAISTLSPSLFTSAPCLKELILHHNCIRFLPKIVENCYIEVLDLHHNKLRSLPESLLASVPKLRCLNLSQNFLAALPPLNQYKDLNKVQVLMLANNNFDDAVFDVVLGYRRLTVLDVSYNNIKRVPDEISSLASLEEFFASGNKLSLLPSTLSQLKKLRCFRAHSNGIHEVPCLHPCESLRILDLANNKLDSTSTRMLIAPGLKCLDLSCNTNMHVDKSAFAQADKDRSIAMIDVKQQSISEQALMRPEPKRSSPPWQIGFCETTGCRNRLCISQVRQKPFGTDADALLCMMDGGQNSDVSTMLSLSLPNTIRNHFYKSSTGLDYLKSAMVKAHLSLRSNGQRLGAAVAVCHVLLPPGSTEYCLRVANVGNIEVVLCRGGEAVLLTEKHILTRQTHAGRNEYARVRSGGGIFTADCELNGITPCTRMIGNSFLYPTVLPNAHARSAQLCSSDEFVIVASRSLWEMVDYGEAIRRIRYISNPILAAKHLQDVAQSYGCQQNLSIIVLRFFFNAKPSNPRQPDAADIGLSLSTRGKIYSAVDIADSDDDSLSSAIDEVQSEPRDRGAVRDRPNYYFDYKKQLKELCDSESTIYSSNISSCSATTVTNLEGIYTRPHRRLTPTPPLADVAPYVGNYDCNQYAESLVKPSYAKMVNGTSTLKTGSTTSSGIGRSEAGTLLSVDNHRLYYSRTCSSPDLYPGYQSNGGLVEERNVRDDHRRTHSFGNLEEGIFSAKSAVVLKEIAF